MWVANFIHRETGTDPAERLRGRYDSRLTCARFLAFNGGLEKIVTNMMNQFPAGEDVVIVRHEGRLACGIHAGGAVAIKDENGVAIIRNLEIVKGWQIWSKQ